METVREIIARIVASNMFGDYRVKHRHPFDNEVADTIIAALGSAGYAIVPREPTRAMRLAGRADYAGSDAENIARLRYQAMLTAAAGEEET